MNEEERRKFDQLAADVAVLNHIVVDLCRTTYVEDDIERIFSPRARISEGHAESLKIVKDALERIRRRVMLPVIGK